MRGVGRAQAGDQLQRVVRQQRQAQDHDVGRSGVERGPHLRFRPCADRQDAILPQRLVDRSGAEIPVVHQQRARAGDRRQEQPVGGEAQGAGRFPTSMPFVQHPLEAHQAAHPRHQRVVFDRLGEEVVRPRLEAAQALARFAERRDHDDRDVHGFRPRLQPAAALVPVHARHHDVEQDEVGLPGQGLLEGFRAVPCRGDLVVFRRKLGVQQPHVGRNVVHDQDPRGHATFSSPPDGNPMTCQAPSASQLSPASPAFKATPDCAARSRERGSVSVELRLDRASQSKAESMTSI